MVDLPQPLGPTRAVVLPAGIFKFKFRKTGVLARPG